MFCTSGDVSPGFQSQDVQDVADTCVCSLRVTSSATPANLLMASMAAGHIPHILMRLNPGTDPEFYNIG